MATIRRLISGTLRKLGYEIRPVDDRRLLVDSDILKTSPLSLRYHLINCDYHMALPLDKARAGIKKLADYHYTIATTSARVAEAGQAYGQMRETLTQIYLNDRFPASAAERIGLQEGEVPDLDQVPPWVSFYPWEPQTIDQKYRAIEAWSKKHERGLIEKETGGRPVSKEEEIEFDCKRLFELYVSIKKRGYMSTYPGSSPVAAQVLIADNKNYCWVISGGYHRCSVCRALGIESIEARIRQVVHRDEAENWPGVVHGIFTTHTALKVFDAHFD